MFAFPVLIGDIGGTNARFAVVEAPGAGFTALPRAMTAAAPTPQEAMREVLARHPGAPPRSAIVARKSSTGRSARKWNTSPV